MAITDLEPSAQPTSGGGTATVASRSRDWAKTAPDTVAMRDKDFGIWRERTWAQLWDEIEMAAHGLLALGVDVGDRVSIYCEDRP